MAPKRGPFLFAARFAKHDEVSRIVFQPTNPLTRIREFDVTAGSFSGLKREKAAPPK